MATTGNLWSTTLDVGRDTGDKWTACPLSTLENALNNASYVPANATITKVQLYVGASWYCGLGSGSNGYIRYGLGGTSNISKELFAKSNILGGANELNVNQYPSGGVDITSYLNTKVAPNAKFKTDNGNYLTFCFSAPSTNIGKKIYHVKSVTLEITYHTHSYTATVTKPATCIETGIKTYTCSCGDSYTETIKLSDHTPGPVPTCETAQVCTVCGLELIAPYGHRFVTWTSDNNATCTADGTKTAICTRDGCNATNTITDVGSAKGHDYDEGVITTPPTCATQGVKTYTCRNDPSHKVIEAVPTTDEHSPSAPARENEKAPTCTTDGSYEKVVYCSVCGKELSRETVILPATGHSPSCYPQITSVQMLYQNRQISADNKVPVDEYFRIVVGVKTFH